METEDDACKLNSLHHRANQKVHLSMMRMSALSFSMRQVDMPLQLRLNPPELQRPKK